MQRRCRISSRSRSIKRFERLDDVISQDELRGIFERYQKVAGYHVNQVGR